MPQVSPALVDWAFDKELATGKASYWKNLDPDSPEWADFIRAVRGPLVDWAFDSGLAKGTRDYWHSLDPTSAEWAKHFFPAIGPNAPGQPIVPPGSNLTGQAPVPTVAPGSLSADAPDQPPGSQVTQLPGRPQVWQAPDGTLYAVYFGTQFNPPLPMGWKLNRPLDQLAAEGETITPIPVDPIAAGLVIMGNESEIPPTEGEGDAAVIDAVLDRMVDESRVRPYLRDSQVFAVVFGARMEGRAPTRAELQSTRWWSTQTEAAREWAVLSEADPATATQARDDARIAVRNALVAAGMDSPPEDLITTMADAFVSGQWTRPHLETQIGLATNSSSFGTLDPLIAPLLSGVDTTRARESRVRDLFRTWLGPALGNQSDAEIARWAGVLRNDPDGEANLTDFLKTQRQTHLPGPDGNPFTPDATYDSIAAPYRQEWARWMGALPDETDANWTEALRLNNLAEFGSKVRGLGISRDNPHTVQQAQRAALSSFSQVV